MEPDAEREVAQESVEHRRYAGFVGPFGWAIVAVVIGYVLSIGPGAFVADRLPQYRGAADFVYAPLILMAEHVPSARRVLEWYVHLWGVG